MKRLLPIAFALCVVAVVGFTANRAPARYRVVFELTSKDTLNHRALLRWVKEVTTLDPTAEVEVVMYGKGFELVMPERSGMSADVQAAIKTPHVSFKVCAVALKNNNIVVSQLFPGVTTVPDGIREVVMKQQEKWGYVKATVN